MRVMTILAAVIVTSGLLGQAAGLLAQAPPSRSVDHARVVEAFLEAYNTRDLDAMLALAHDEIEWLMIDGTKVATETSGKDALRRSMTGYFASCPSCRSTMVAGPATAARIAVIETASWQAASGPRSQASLAVYEFADGLIRRVTYFPSEK